MNAKDLHEKFELLDEDEIYKYLDLMAAWMPADEWDYLLNKRMKHDEGRGKK